MPKLYRTRPDKQAPVTDENIQQLLSKRDGLTKDIRGLNRSFDLTHDLATRDSVLEEMNGLRAQIAEVNSLINHPGHAQPDGVVETPTPSDEVVATADEILRGFYYHKGNLVAKIVLAARRKGTYLDDIRVQKDHWLFRVDSLDETLCRGTNTNRTRFMNGGQAVKRIENDIRESESRST
jgi:hypothetical protein